MYHRVEKETQEDLTISLKNLEQQFKYLKENNYSSKFFSEIDTPSKKSIILTFDDGYKNNFDYLPPLLEKYSLKATIFIPTKFIQEGYKDYELMTFEDIRNLNKKYFEIALHSHAHENFRDISTNHIEDDLRNNMQILDNENITYSKILAYPYGKYSKNNPEKSNVFNILKNLDLKYAVRIGNKINFFPTKKPYELCRIDIKGKNSLIIFKLKLIFGRLKLF
ncbi:hypothetical protein GCM10023210_38220 [Chryseobacterium ginsengisoli]|uniref:NodB homology domain-containing protein n=1 Tax=Chryseobacterium ginsengisoli TaxID=363853 RepID=A0ABP9MTU8_9FLAO